MLVLLAAPAFCQQETATDPAGGGTALAAIANQKARPAGPAPRASDGKPDLSGIWSPDRTFIYDISSSLKPGEELPLQPWAAKLAKERMSKDDPEANCLPAGVPRMAPYPWKIVQTPKLWCFCTRAIFILTGRCFWMAAVIRRIRIRAGMAIRPASGRATRWWWIRWGSTTGSGLTSPDIRTLRSCTWWSVTAGRIPEHLDYDVTIEDPGAYTKPFTMHGHSVITSGELMEYVCNENNQDVPHILGKDTRK